MLHADLLRCTLYRAESSRHLANLQISAEPESGECLIRFRYRKESDGLSVPLQLQVLEPDYLDSQKFEDLPNGGWIQHGIEYNAIGQRAAFKSSIVKLMLFSLIRDKICKLY